MPKTVPLAVREWLQTVSLSLPSGVRICVAGGAPLALHMGWDINSIDVFLIGAEVLEDRYKWRTATDEWDNELKYLKFYGREFEEEDSSNIPGVDYDIVEATRLMLFEDCDVWFYFIKTTDMSFMDVMLGFDFDICRAHVVDLHTVDWEVKLMIKASQAIKNKEVIVTNSDGIFLHNTVCQHKRLVKYKEKLEGFRFIKEL